MSTIYQILNLSATKHVGALLNKRPQPENL